MNFNSDYQSNQNRLHGLQVVTKDLEESSSSNAKIIRIICEVLFVVLAIALGYVQGIKSPTSYTEVAQAAYSDSNPSSKLS